MGAHESTKNSHAKSSAAGIGRGDRRPLVSGDRVNIEFRNAVGPNQRHRTIPTVSTQCSTPTRSSQDTHFGSRSDEDIGAQATDITSRGRIAYMKAVKKARGKGTKPYKIPHDAIVNSMMKVENILAGTTPMPIMPLFGKQMMIFAAKADSTQASTSKNMQRSMSERIVTTRELPPNNRIRDQMRKEKLINEEMRTKFHGEQCLNSRTQSFILPRTLHVIPEQPEEESKDPENYSYSDINVYF